MTEPLLTASEVAQLLKLNVETVYTLIRTSGLPAAKIGSQWRFVESDLRRWVQVQTQTPQGHRRPENRTHPSGHMGTTGPRDGDDLHRAARGDV